MGQSTEEAEFEHFALLARKLLQRLKHGVAQANCFERIASISCGRYVFIGEGHVAEVAPPQDVESVIARHACKPARQVAVAEKSACAPEFQENYLRYVFGGALILTDAVSDSKDEAMVAVVERFKSGHFAGPQRRRSGIGPESCFTQSLSPRSPDDGQRSASLHITPQSPSQRYRTMRSPRSMFLRSAGSGLAA
jgi:hypothetical protein